MKKLEHGVGPLVQLIIILGVGVPIVYIQKMIPIWVGLLVLHFLAGLIVFSLIRTDARAKERAKATSDLWPSLGLGIIVLVIVAFSKKHEQTSLEEEWRAKQRTSFS